MKRSHLFGAILALVLMVSVAVATIVPALAHNNRDDDKKPNPADPNKEYVYGRGGRIVLNLPAGGVCNKTNIGLSFLDVDNRSTKGAEDCINVELWIPSQSRFRFMVMIDDNPVAITSSKTMFSGMTYVQYIQVADTELEVWREGDTIIANLTKPIDITFGNPLPPTSIYRDLNFTLPAMTVTFVKNGPIYEKTETTTTYTGWAGASNWTVTTKYWNAPGFVSVSIPAWLGSATLPVAGYYREKIVLDITKP
jgi:hypothetical protein